MKKKKVTFNLRDNKIHLMVVWNYAYKLSRKKYWEILALDRVRFHRKIEEISNIINSILDSSHRYNVYNDRFYNLNDT